MSNPSANTFWYAEGFKHMMNGDLEWAFGGCAISAILCSAAYTPTVADTFGVTNLHELSTALGYTEGGKSLEDLITCTYLEGVPNTPSAYILSFTTAPVWASCSGFTFQTIVVVDTTHSKLLGWVYYSAPQTITGSLTLMFPTDHYSGDIPNCVFRVGVNHNAGTANAVEPYTCLGNQLATANFDAVADSFYMALLTSSYTPDPYLDGTTEAAADHKSAAEILAEYEVSQDVGYVTGGVLLTGVALSAYSAGKMTFDFDDVVFNLTGERDFEFLFVYNVHGIVKYPIAYIWAGEMKTPSAPFIVAVSSGADKFFKSTIKLVP